MASLTLTGLVYSISAPKQISDKLTVQEFILCVDPSANYPAYIPMQAKNDKMSLLQGLAPNQFITVHYYLNGRLVADKTTGAERAYATFDAWKIEPANIHTQAPAQAPNQQAPQQQWQQPAPQQQQWAQPAPPAQQPPVQAPPQAQQWGTPPAPQPAQQWPTQQGQPQPTPGTFPSQNSPV